MQKEILEITKDAPLATDTEVRAYYETFKANITSPGRSLTRQLTIYANTTNSDEKLEYIKGVASNFNGTNICALISQYSEDATTRSTCGTYDATQGQLLPEYEEAVFASNVGDVKIIGTRVGYHLVFIEALQAPRQLSYEESRDAIASYLDLVKKQQVLEQRLKDLRADAEVQVYPTE